MLKKCIFYICCFWGIFVIGFLGWVINNKYADELIAQSNKNDVIESFYNEAYFESMDVIESLYFNHGIFEFMLNKNAYSEREMIERYFSLSFPNDVALIEYELLDDELFDDSDMSIGSAHRIVAVVCGEQQVINNMFKYKYRYKMSTDDEAVAVFNKIWGGENSVSKVSEFCCEPSVYCYYNKSGEIIRGMRNEYLFFADVEEGGQQSVYMTIGGIGLTGEEGW